jgi:cytochrome b subunit of formate dehydrogenase
VQEAERRRGAAAPPREYQRFSLNFRIQHVILFSSCIVLILTGLPIKFHDTAWAAAMFGLMGGIQNSALVHRVGAVGLIGVGLYHLLYTGVLAEGRRNFFALIPGPKDLRDAALMIRYFLGRTEERPRFGRFSYVEKFDYWAVYWGMIIMCGSGLMLWFENDTMRLFPKYIFDIAKEAHSDEALLATLAIIIWHFYNVHFNPHKFPMNKVWITGRMSEEEMRHEHPLELEEIQRRERQGKAEAR